MHETVGERGGTLVSGAQSFVLARETGAPQGPLGEKVEIAVKTVESSC